MNKIVLKKNHINPHAFVRYLNDRDVTHIAAYLLSLGIEAEHLESFICGAKDTDRDNPYLLDNMTTAVNLAYEKLEAGAKVFVQVDSDTDGYTSAAVLINYLKRRYPRNEIVYALHPGKEHGIVLDVIPDDADLIFVPDAGSNDFEEQRAVLAQGKTLIILDHHEISVMEHTGACVVNNQISPRFSNKYLSGVGIVYMFLTALDDKYSNRMADDFLDLTAVGIIADAMNMTSVGNNFICHRGLNRISNPFLKEIITKQARGIVDAEHLTKKDVMFYIAPVINGVIRSGAPEDKEIVFRALTNENSSEVFESEWRGKKRFETLYQFACRSAVNAKSRQDSTKKKSFEWLCGKIKKHGWDKDNLIIATLDEQESTKVSPNVTGLIAMELVKEFNKPVLVLRKTEYEGLSVYGGSGRNGNFYNLPSLLDFLHISNLIYYGEGHANAFGTFIEPDKVELLREYSNTHLDAATFTNIVHEVDYWFKEDEAINQAMLMQFASYNHLYGNSLPAPKFAFSFFYEPNDVKIMGADGTSLKLSHDGIDFVIFKNAAVVAAAQNSENCHATIVGWPSINEWMGRKTIQITIEDISLEPHPGIATPTATVTNLFDLI